MQKPAYIVLVAVLLIAAITNPSEEKHQRVAAAFASKAMKKNSVMGDGFLSAADEIMGDGFASAIVAGVAKFMITSQSYVFFSLTKVISNDKIIGIGAFGNVYLFPNLTFGGDDDDDDDEQQTSPAPARQMRSAPVPPPTVRGAFSIQIMADEDIDIIQKEKNKAQSTINKPVFIVFIEPYYKLWVGDFSTKAQAEEILPTVKSKGYKDAWIVGTKAITGSARSDVSGGKIDNRLVNTWVGEGGWLKFRADGTFVNEDGIQLGTWYTEGNKITVTSNGQTTTESYVVNITVTQDEDGEDWEEGTLRIGNKEYEMWTP